MTKPSESVIRALDAALRKRTALLADPGLTACRLLHDRADGIEGLVVEKLADVLVLQRHEGRLRLSEGELRGLAECLRRRVEARAVYVKHFVRDRSRAEAEVAERHRDPRPWLGEPVEPERIVCEYGLRFIVRPYDGFSVGLFLEHRDNRQRVRRLAAGRRVLNAFSYTGAFSVAAAVGGAASVASVDISKRYLAWSRDNFAANALDASAHRFYCSDIFDFYRRAHRQGLRYDLIVLDPPSFARLRRPKRTFVLADRLEELVAEAVTLLEPGGVVLLASNHRGIGVNKLRAALENGAGRYRCRVLEIPELPVDFAGDPDYAKTVIACFE